MVRLDLWLCCYCSLVLGAACIQKRDLFPYGAEVGDDYLPRSDDSTSPPLILPLLPFYDDTSSTIFVNNNGVVSLDKQLEGYNRMPFPIPGGIKVIAPYWADVDTTAVGSVWYRFTNSEESYDILRAKLLHDGTLFADIDVINFDPVFVFIATWDSVGYYDGHSDKNNTFQCVISTDGVISFVIFLYPEDGINWSTGDASGGNAGLGGTSAQVGFNAGDGMRSLSLPASQTDKVLDIDNTVGNSGTKGLWVFRVDTVSVNMPGDCDSSEESLELIPNHGNMLGGTPVIVKGFCFDQFSTVICVFGTKNVTAFYIDSKQAVCISPQMDLYGEIPFVLQVMNANSILFQSSTIPYYSLSYISTHDISVTTPTGLLLKPGSSILLKWSPSLLLEQLMQTKNQTVTISLFKLSKLLEWTHMLCLKTYIMNSGSAEVVLPDAFPHNETESLLPVMFHVMMDSTDSCVKSDNNVPVLWSQPFYLEVSSIHYTQCSQWLAANPFSALEQLPCPCNIQQASLLHSGLVQQSNNLERFFNWKEHTCFSPPNIIFPQSVARQCCYNNEGLLAFGFEGGVTLSFSPRTRSVSQNLAFWEHFQSDVVPYVYCCKADIKLCDSFVKSRALVPSQRQWCSSDPQLPAIVFGDPHFLSFDGSMYTFNGKGEFLLADISSGYYRIQGRMIEVPHVNGGPASATGLSAIVVRQMESSSIQFEVSRRGLDVFIDGGMVHIEENSELVLKEAAVIHTLSDVYHVSFSSGLLLEVKEKFGIIFRTMINLPSLYHNQTVGLFGLFNGDRSDDLLPHGSTQPLDSSASLLIIHEGFGLTWINDNPMESLFMYNAGNSWRQFFDPGFSAEVDPSFLPLEGDQAECENDIFCLFDIVATGKLEFARDTKMISNLIQKASMSVNCSPPCQNGACSKKNVCSCFIGYTGQRCEFEVPALICNQSICYNGGTCRQLEGDHTCYCSPAYSGLLCETALPLDLDCDFSVDSTDTLWAICTSNRHLQNVTCSLGMEHQPCIFPQAFDVSEFLPGNYQLHVKAKDIYGISAEEYLMYNRLPLECHFINSSPRVSGSSLAAEFSLNRPVLTVTCQIKGLPAIDASSRWVRYQNLSGGRYSIIIEARAKNKERVVLRRKTDIADNATVCVVNLINTGVSVQGRNVAIQFYGDGPIISYICILDRITRHPCTSIYRLYNLMAGSHHLQVIPQGCGRRYRKLTVAFTVS